ncbi:MAG: SCO1664 family protein [Caldilineales bacterium]|nr:SCO1664 family protein [Caldilineales bacterium]
MTSTDGERRVTFPLELNSVLELLHAGAMEEQSIIPWSSNYAMLVEVQQEGMKALAIYKPRRGERPLWDFPPGTLYLREYAAFALSQALGWGMVPPTVLRSGLYGPGSVQLFIDSDPEEHYFNIYPRHAEDFQRIVLFDAIANNADRKAGHCLLDASDHMWSIDHGICFHVEPKLRTVIWEFADDRIPENLLQDLQKFQRQFVQGQPVYDGFSRILSQAETEAMCRRLDMLVQTERFPSPDPHRRNHPWPPI